MLRPHRGKGLALDLVHRLDRNNGSSAEGRNDGEPVRQFAMIVQIARPVTALQEPC